MKLYGVKHKSLQSGVCLWQKIENALEEIKTHLEEGTVGDTIELTITEMSEEAYNKLLEFEGY